VLLLRLHAFLALTLAALVVAGLTPASARSRQLLLAEAKKSQIAWESLEEQRIELSLAADVAIDPGDRVVAIRSMRGMFNVVDPWTIEEVARFTVVEAAPRMEGETRRRIIAEWEPGEGHSESPPLEAGDLFVTARQLEAADRAGAKASPPEEVAFGFGNTAAGIGLLIAFASIIGKCLLESGSADRVVRSALRLTGERGAPAAFVGSGFLLGIPVFFDTVFYLMLPLGQALRMRTGRDYLLYILAIVAGATMAHSLVPPTPGPLLVAGELNVSIGLMILVGLVIGGGATFSGYLYALALNRRFELPLREIGAPMEANQLDDRPLPPLWLAIAPIVLPLLLIGGAEALLNARKMYPEQFAWPPASAPAIAWRTIEFVGNKNVALLIAAAVAIGAVVRQRGTSREALAGLLQNALAGAGVIILITGAGGAFGRAIQNTGIASLVSELPVQSTPAILTLAFLITAAVRTAQGSATVAMITAVGILAPLAASGQLGFHPVYLAMAIGCGSKPISWMNDSGFWVITQTTGMTEREGLRYVTTLLLVMSVAGLALTIAGAMLVPMA
jgi:gluconate:H+ symporter, GntP family